MLESTSSYYQGIIPIRKNFFALGDSVTHKMYNVVAYKTLMGLTFTLCATRLMQFLQINSKMGPKVSSALQIESV